MKSCAVAVIGHVDHGKTTLVGALTGTETDRLKEEKERGLSITLGFAYKDYSTGTIDFIDAPGHEDFIRAMVSGATGAQAVLLVVSAVDGVERQTREHLQIAAMLGIKTGVVALTKSDLLSETERQAQKSKITAELIGTSLEGQPILFCSARFGEGLIELHKELEGLIERVPPSYELAGFFLPVDRVFSSRGMGTVVTGTLLGKTLSYGKDAVVQPSGQRVAVRGMQIHGSDSDAISSGGRLAVNLRKVAVGEIKRGDVLCEPDVFPASAQVDVLLTLSPESDRPLDHVDDVRVMFGASNEIASVRLLGTRQIAPGESGFAQLRFSTPVITFAGQRAVLRRPSPQETIGGAIVLDPAASMLSKANVQEKISVMEAAKSGDVANIAEALSFRDGGLIRVAEAARLVCKPVDIVRNRLQVEFDEVDKNVMASRAVIANAGRAYMERLQVVHADAPAIFTVSVNLVRDVLQQKYPLGLIKHVETKLIAKNKITLWGEQLSATSHDPFAALSDRQRLRLEVMEVALINGALAPSEPSDLIGVADGNDDLINLLVQSGRSVLLHNFALKKNLMFHKKSLEEGVKLLKSAFPYPVTFKTGDARAALGTTRKYIIPVLEYFDEQEITFRKGNVRFISEKL